MNVIMMLCINYCDNTDTLGGFLSCIAGGGGGWGGGGGTEDTKRVDTMKDTMEDVKVGTKSQCNYSKLSTVFLPASHEIVSENLLIT